MECPKNQACAQDAVVLARALREVMQAHASSPGASVSTVPRAALAQALRSFERERSAHKLKIAVRSNLMGAVLQIPFGPVRAHCLFADHITAHVFVPSGPVHCAAAAMQVVAARNYAVSRFLPVKDFLDHASFDCGTL
jgi:hypothetical protein